MLPPKSLLLHAAMNILDVTVVENDPLSLQNAFRSWLHDCGTDTEYLHLILPSPPSSHHSTGAGPGRGDEDTTWELSPTDEMGGGKEGGLVLKCDVQERILCPASAFNAKIRDQFVSFIIRPPPYLGKS